MSIDGRLESKFGQKKAVVLFYYLVLCREWTQRFVVSGVTFIWCHICQYQTCDCHHYKGYIVQLHSKYIMKACKINSLCNVLLTDFRNHVCNTKSLSCQGSWSAFDRVSANQVGNFSLPTYSVTN